MNKFVLFIINELDKTGSSIVSFSILHCPFTSPISGRLLPAFGIVVCSIEIIIPIWSTLCHCERKVKRNCEGKVKN